MIKAIVTGALGRMGTKVISAIQNTDGIELIGAIERKGHPSVGENIGSLIGDKNIKINLEDSLKNIIEKADVVIDFTIPSSALEHLRIATKSSTSMVIGTTGFSEQEMKDVKSVGTKIPCVFSPNMGVCVNLMFKLIGDVAKKLGGDYDIEILELHHNKKKDSPSGTAIKMGEVIANSLKKDLKDIAIYSRQGFIGERKKGSIGLQSLRLGDVIGEHTVFFAGTGERLEITHRVSNRDNFARGAVIAAKWIVGKKNGIYDMMDVIGLK